VAVSLGLHVLLAGFVVATPSLFPQMGSELWGSPDAGMSGISVGLAPSVGGMALPIPDVVNDTAAATQSAGFYEEEAPPPEPEPPPVPDTAVEPEPIARDPVPVEDVAPPPTPPASPAPEPESAAGASPTPPTPDREPAPEAPSRPDNAIPFGDGGQPALPFGRPDSGDGTGMSMGDGVFGNRYGTYVEAIRRKISGNWLQSMIDPGVRSARRVYISFDIERSGEIVNVQVADSSGNRQVDNSARRAVLSSTPLQPLPRDYRGARVSVRF
jgi:TonB family protein